MSVVVATEHYILGDRRISDDDGIHRPITKVFRNRYLMAGIIGDYGCILAGECLVTRHHADCPQTFTDVLNSDSEAVVVMNGRIYLVGEKVREVRGPVAIGSGAHAVLGYLAATGPLTPKICQAAMRYAFTVQPSCGDGITLLRPKV